MPRAASPYVGVDLAHPDIKLLVTIAGWRADERTNAGTAPKATTCEAAAIPKNWRRKHQERKRRDRAPMLRDVDGQVPAFP